MGKKQYFDMHCDTLTKFYEKGVLKDSLNLDENVIALSKVPKDQLYGQFFAVFVPDRYKGSEAAAFFTENARNFIRQCNKFSDRIIRCRNYEDVIRAWNADKIAGILTIENGAAYGGNLDNIGLAREMGVCVCSLTWNGANDIGSGKCYPDMPISGFGKDCVREMENNNIIVDVSHLNDIGFYDVLRIAKRPFIATHSNCRSITDHPRNLTDNMIREIIEMQGLIGLNYYIKFLNADAAKASMEDLYRHAEHILELGGEDVLALGSDFDGCDVFFDLNSLEKAFALEDFFVNHGVSSEQAQKITSGNLLNFMKKYYNGAQ